MSILTDLAPIIGSGNAAGVPRLTVGVTAHGARPIRAGHVGVTSLGGTVEQSEAEGGNMPMPAHDIDTIGRIAVVADPLGEEPGLVGPR